MLFRLPVTIVLLLQTTRTKDKRISAHNHTPLPTQQSPAPPSSLRLPLPSTSTYHWVGGLGQLLGSGREAVWSKGIGEGVTYSSYVSFTAAGQYDKPLNPMMENAIEVSVCHSSPDETTFPPLLMAHFTTEGLLQPLNRGAFITRSVCHNVPDETAIPPLLGWLGHHDAGAVKLWCIHHTFHFPQFCRRFFLMPPR